jgi:hypothetical protein
MIIKDMPAIDAAINGESWEWLRENLPVLAGAVSLEIKNGATADDVRLYVMRRTQRPALAMRCSQAAAHLIRQRQEQ